MGSYDGMTLSSFCGTEENLLGLSSFEGLVMQTSLSASPSQYILQPLREIVKVQSTAFVEHIPHDLFSANSSRACVCFGQHFFFRVESAENWPASPLQFLEEFITFDSILPRISESSVVGFLKPLNQKKKTPPMLFLLQEVPTTPLKLSAWTLRGGGGR